MVLRPRKGDPAQLNQSILSLPLSKKVHITSTLSPMKSFHTGYEHHPKPTRGGQVTSFGPYEDLYAEYENFPSKSEFNYK